MRKQLKYVRCCKHTAKVTRKAIGKQLNDPKRDLAAIDGKLNQGAEKIYRNRENLSYCKERGIRLSGPALGRPPKGEERNKVQDYRDECEWVEVERKVSLGKRKCGMGLVTAKPEDTAAHVAARSILLLNLRKIQWAFLKVLDWILAFLQPCEKSMVIQ